MISPAHFPRKTGKWKHLQKRWQEEWERKRWYPLPWQLQLSGPAPRPWTTGRGFSPQIPHSPPWQKSFGSLSVFMVESTTIPRLTFRPHCWARVVSLRMPAETKTKSASRDDSSLSWTPVAVTPVTDRPFLIAIPFFSRFSLMISDAYRSAWAERMVSASSTTVIFEFMFLQGNRRFPTEDPAADHNRPLGGIGLILGSVRHPGRSAT